MVGTCSQPPAPQGLLAPCHGALHPPCQRAGSRVGKDQWGRESAAHFGLEGESEKQIHESRWWGWIEVLLGRVASCVACHHWPGPPGA